MIYICQKGKKEGIMLLVIVIMRCIFRTLRDFKTMCDMREKMRNSNGRERH